MSMQRLFFVIAVISFSSSSAQTPKINGIGKFQIGKTTSSIITDLSNQYGLKINETSDNLATIDEFTYIDTPTKILFISKEANETKDFPHAKYLPLTQVKVFYLNNIQIAGLIFHNVFLQFYKDTLYHIEADSDDYIDSALELKYGPPKITQKKRIINCSNAYRNFEYEEFTLYRSWGNPGKHISAISVNSFYYNSKCEKENLHYLDIYDFKIEDKVNTQLNQSEKEKQVQRDKDKKKTITDL
jgi:hypothetical protein